MMASHKPMLITTTTKLLDAIRVIHDSIHIRPRTTLQASWRPPVASLCGCQKAPMCGGGEDFRCQLQASQSRTLRSCARS